MQLLRSFFAILYFTRLIFFYFFRLNQNKAIGNVVYNLY